ncbi:MAG TPA: BatD family protein, partial [Candidatus Babeliales bacterium]|nr:BatD family protein [Candidatus Babeliales bacterium]
YQSNGVTSRLSVMNGSAQSQRTYSYLVRLDQPGHYQLGPAQVTLGDEAVNSNQLTITVLAPTEENLAQQAAEQLANGSNVSSVQTARSDTRPALTSNTGHDSAARSNSVSEHQPQTPNAAPAQIKLLCQQPQAYVGEKVPITIRVYTNSNDLKLTNLQQLQAPDFQLGELIKGAAGVTTLNGASYFYQDYTQLLTPTKAGDFLIPAIALDYAAPAGRQNWFWFTSYVQRQAYSNSLKLQIKPLPTPATSLPAPVLVGAFTGFKAQLAKATLAPGEGTVFSLTVTVPAERTYDLAEVQLDRLELGPALRAYFSKATDIAPNQRRFEFVLQGLRSGAFTIPAQKLNFFHPVIRKYQTLSTTPMAVTITGTQTVASDQAVTSSAAPTAWPLLTVNQVAG